MFVQYLPSQVDSTASTTALPYTASPLALVWYDVGLFFSRLLYLPGTISPLHPWGSGPLDELYPSRENTFLIVAHILLIIAQLLFLLSLPMCIFYPLVAVMTYVGGFITLNYFICRVLNGRAPFVKSNVTLDHPPKDDECWIYLNGISVGHHWLQNNVNRLAMTFGREVLGVHNPTLGIIFDVIQCLIERDFAYSTQDIRNSYVLVRRAIKDEKYKKVVLILHSQGGIEGGLMIDWLLADLPEVCFNKLEVYTFGSAANHFNNPICSARSQSPDPESPPDEQTSGNQRVIRHVEHYANSGDFVCQWGVLHFTQSPEFRNNRFIGQLFERKNNGHLLNQHYLDHMFPMDPSTKRVRDTNEFVETMVEVDDRLVPEREPASHSFARTPISQLPVTEADSSLSAVNANVQQVKKKPVKELSRLWKYRNGGSPD